MLMSIQAKLHSTGEIVTGIVAIRALSRQEATRIEPKTLSRAIDPLFATPLVKYNV